MFAEDFIHHIHEEEDLLFTYIQQLTQAQHKANSCWTAYRSMEKSSLLAFAKAHETHDDEMQGIRDITRHYRLPAAAPLLWQVVYAELQAFEQELRFHADLENLILFPKAMVLEEIVREKIAKKISLN
jgi:regulator of cell morphogenesis and NO signaling